MITLRPSAEPVPALKYRLVPEHIKLVPGNAAVFYYRASLMIEGDLLGTRGEEESAGRR